MSSWERSNVKEELTMASDVGDGGVCVQRLVRVDEASPYQLVVVEP